MRLKKESVLTDVTSTSLVTSDDAWSRLPERKRNLANERRKLVIAVMKLLDEKQYTLRPAIEMFILQLEVGDADVQLIKVARKLGRKGGIPSYSTLNRWVNGYNQHGLIGLVDNYKGSEREAYGWEARAVHLYSLPSKPSKSAVSRKLISEGFTSATETRVRRYLDSLPANQGEMSRGRLGPRLYENTQKTFKRRSTEHLPVGSCYQGDGHTLDVYLQHPAGNKPWRAELTLWIDVTSRYIAGWYVSEAESAHSTLFALSHAILSHDHIPAMLHIDNGSGFKNKMVSDDSIGFYARLGIDIMHSRPYNAKAKGQVERFFGTMERDHNKWFESYCGADMADEAIQLLLKKVKKGEAQLPTLQQWMASFTDWLNQYHNKPHDGLNGKTPCEVWATLEQHKVEPISAAIFWPRKERTVTRQAIRLDNREYIAPELIQYNNKKVIVEYSLHDDRFIRVMDTKGRWICDAGLISKQDYVPASRIEEAKQKRLVAQVKRLEVHADEKRERAGLALPHDQFLDDVEALNDSAMMSLEDKTGEGLWPSPVSDQLEELDINDLSYLDDHD